jgi:hypothetical protein
VKQTNYSTFFVLINYKFDYNAKNSFGGYANELLVVANGKVLNTDKSWNKYCANGEFEEY